MVRCVILLVYNAPLGKEGSFLFVCNNLDYFGEPSVQIALACGNMLCAFDIWIFGTYGTPLGLTVGIASIVFYQQSALALLYASQFVRPHTNRKSRLKEELGPYMGIDPPLCNDPKMYRKPL